MVTFFVAEFCKLRPALCFLRVPGFESSSPPGTSLPRFACSCIIVSYFSLCYSICSTLFAHGCWIESPLFCRLRDLANRIPSIRRKMRSGSHSCCLLRGKDPQCGFVQGQVCDSSKLDRQSSASLVRQTVDGGGWVCVGSDNSIVLRWISKFEKMEFLADVTFPSVSTFHKNTNLRVKNWLSTMCSCFIFHTFLEYPLHEKGDRSSN